MNGVGGGDSRVARLVCGQVEGFLSVDKQEWTFGRRFGKASSRRTEVKDRWRLSTLAGEYDEGFLNAADLEELENGRFRYRGTCFDVEWLSGEEALAAHTEHFAGWD